MRFSILGDSLSTFHGFNPPGYAVFYDAAMAWKNELNSVEDTWWARVIAAFHGKLAINNAYSGSRVTGSGFPAAASMERLRALKTGPEPDVLLCYMGLNDFGYEVPPGRRNGWLSRPNLMCFADAYPAMLHGLKKVLPRTKVICATLMETCVRDRSELVFPYNIGQMYPLSAYNDIIRDACRRAHVAVADLNADNVVYETLDGTHATRKGHRAIADGWLRALEGVLG